MLVMEGWPSLAEGSRLISGNIGNGIAGSNPAPYSRTPAPANPVRGRSYFQPLDRYAKAGVVLVDPYRPAELPVADMFATRDPAKSKALMGALDAINGRFRRGAARRSNLSPCYTTRLDDMLQVRAL